MIQFLFYVWEMVIHLNSCHLHFNELFKVFIGGGGRAGGFLPTPQTPTSHFEF